MKRKIISATLTAALLMSIVSNTACNLISDPDLLTPSSSRSAAQTETSKTETTTSETSETTTESESGYNLSWSNFDSKEFDKYVQEKCNGQTLASYINLFGFTDELNKMFTGFANELYGKDYESIPFSEANYFKVYLTGMGSSILSGIYTSSYASFRDYYLNPGHIYTEPFNEVLMSYLVRKKIPFGSTIPIEDLKYFCGDDVYQGPKSGYENYIFKNEVPSNKDRSHKYSKKEFLYILLCYNNSMSSLSLSEKIYSRSMFYGDPAYEEESKHLITSVNAHLKEFYGEDAWQLGEIPTEEQYEKIFGKKPLDLSYVDTPYDKDAN